MVKKIFLEEICDRESLKSFLGRFKRLTGLEVVPFNERGEIVIGELDKLFKDKEEASDFVNFPGKDVVERPDGSFVRIMKLEWRGHLYGAVLIGPFSKKGNEYTGSAKIPCMNDAQIDAAVESIDNFFMQMIDLAAEKESLAKKKKSYRFLKKPQI